jgi:hypothetical protein
MYAPFNRRNKKMNHFHQNIKGFFNESHIQLFNAILNKAPDNGTWVEIGSFIGKSIAYIYCESLQRNKNYEFHTIDPFLSHPETESFYKLFKIDGNNLYEEFIKNIEPIKNKINYYRNTSIEVSKKFKDESVDVIYIDGAHDYESVQADIKYWYPKMKKNSIMAFDDYLSPHAGLKFAVDEFVSKEKLQLNPFGWTVYAEIKK